MNQFALSWSPAITLLRRILKSSFSILDWTCVNQDCILPLENEFLEVPVFLWRKNEVSMFSGAGHLFSAFLFSFWWKNEVIALE